MDVSRIVVLRQIKFNMFKYPRMLASFDEFDIRMYRLTLKSACRVPTVMFEAPHPIIVPLSEKMPS